MRNAPPCLWSHRHRIICWRAPGSHHLFGFTGMPCPQKSLYRSKKSSRSSNRHGHNHALISRDFFNFQLTHNCETYQQNGGPLLYFGGYSSSARPLRSVLRCHCRPDTQVGLKASIEDVAHQQPPKVDPLISGQNSVIVRETERKPSGRYQAVQT